MLGPHSFVVAPKIGRLQNSSEGQTKSLQKPAKQKPLRPRRRRGEGRWPVVVCVFHLTEIVFWSIRSMKPEMPYGILVFVSKFYLISLSAFFSLLYHYFGRISLRINSQMSSLYCSSNSYITVTTTFYFYLCFYYFFPLNPRKVFFPLGLFF